MGSFGLFFTCFLIFCRFLPMIAMAEVKGVLNAHLRPQHKMAAAPPEPGVAAIEETNPVSLDLRPEENPS